MRNGVWGGLFALGILVLTRPAAAAGDYPVFVSPGYIHSFVRGHSPASGNGGELSAGVGTSTGGQRTADEIGAFTQLEALHGDAGTSTRWALGAQGSVLGLGFELAYVMRSADDAHSTTRGVHIAPFFSLGYFYLAHRWTVTIGDGTHGNEHAFVLALKIPFAVRGDMRDFISLPAMLVSDRPVTYGN